MPQPAQAGAQPHLVPGNLLRHVWMCVGRQCIYCISHLISHLISHAAPPVWLHFMALSVDCRCSSPQTAAG